MASRLKKLQRGEQERLAAGEARAGRLEAGADEARESFDAASAAREVASAQFADFRRDLGEGLESQEDRQVGAGRVDTGFGFQDADRLTGRFEDKLAREVSRNAFNAAQLNLRNIEGRTGAAERGRDRDLDLLTGATDRAQAIQNEKQQRKRSRFGLLGGVAGGVGGFILGGPAGAQLGAKLGSTVGSNI